MYNNNVAPRMLEVRSGIFFEYPKLKSTEKNLMFFLPFWENPIISENKQARLVEYNPINRGSSLFAHTGADARNITISFYLTVPHIMRSINSVLNSQALINSLSSDKEKKRFKNKNPFIGNIKTNKAEDNLKLWKDKRDELFSEKEELKYLSSTREFNRKVDYRIQGTKAIMAFGELSDELIEYFAPEISAEAHAAYAEEKEGLYRIRTSSKQALKAINTAVYILETIRSCVAGNATTSILGPPVLRLRHGAAYNDVPLICKDYDISVEENAGYDLKTLLPNRIKIKLRTSELRTGDFGKFNPGTYLERDNLAGWEAVHEHGSADPGFLK